MNGYLFVACMLVGVWGEVGRGVREGVVVGRDDGDSGCADDSPLEGRDRGIMNFRLHIVNGSGEDLLLASNSSDTAVTGWEFVDIPIDDESDRMTSRAFNITFNSREVRYYTSEVTYIIGKSNENSFTIRAERCVVSADNAPCLSVLWSVDESLYAVAPQSDLGYRNNSSIDVVVVKKDAARETLVEPRDTERTNAHWMDLSADVIADLNILQMSWPCSHDSGTYKPKMPFVDLYATTQFKSIYDQLKDGVRVLDIRVGWEKGEWVITHGMYVMSYTVTSAIREVQDFIDEFPQEFVILDFHNLNHLRGEDEPNRAALKAHVRSALGSYHLDHSAELSLSSSLRSLWNAGQGNKQRILLSWNTDPAQFGEGEPWMWPSIFQKWFQHVQTVEELYGNLTYWWHTSPDWVPALDLYPDQSPPLPSYPENTFHSSCVFTNSLLPLPTQSKLLEDNIVEWFHGTDAWSLNANIVSVNFVPHGNDIVDALIVANLVKGYNKSNGLPLLEAPVEV